MANQTTSSDKTAQQTNNAFTPGEIPQFGIFVSLRSIQHQKAYAEALLIRSAQFTAGHYDNVRNDGTRDAFLFLECHNRQRSLFNFYDYSAGVYLCDQTGRTHVTADGTVYNNTQVFVYRKKNEDGTLRGTIEGRNEAFAKVWAFYRENLLDLIVRFSDSDVWSLCYTETKNGKTVTKHLKDKFSVIETTHKLISGEAGKSAGFEVLYMRPTF